MGQASSFAFPALDMAIQRYVLAAQRGEACPTGQEFGVGCGGSCLRTGSDSLPWGANDFHFSATELRLVAPFLPECLSTLDLYHPALLFALDCDRDGLFSNSDLRHFLEWAVEALPVETPLDDVAEALRGRALLHCWYHCHLKSREQESSKKVGSAEEMDRDFNTREARAYFARWMVRLLRSVDVHRALLLHSTTTTTTPPLPLVPSLPAAVLDDGLLDSPERGMPLIYIGCSRTKDGIHSVASIDHDECFHGGIYQDPVSLSQESIRHRFAESSTRESSSHRPLAQDGKEKNRESNLGLSSEGLGIKALDDLYKLLSIRDLYGLSFWSLCQMLHPCGAAEVEKAAFMKREDAVVAWMDAESVVAHYLQLSRNTAEGSDPVMLFSVPVDAVEGFLMCFCNAYWGTLKRAGLRPSDRTSEVVG